MNTNFFFIFISFLFNVTNLFSADSLFLVFLSLIGIWINLISYLNLIKCGFSLAPILRGLLMFRGRCYYFSI